MKNYSQEHGVLPRARHLKTIGLVSLVAMTGGSAASAKASTTRVKGFCSPATTLTHNLAKDEHARPSTIQRVTNALGACLVRLERIAEERGNPGQLYGQESFPQGNMLIEQVTGTLTSPTTNETTATFGFGSSTPLGSHNVQSISASVGDGNGYRPSGEGFVLQSSEEGRRHGWTLVSQKAIGGKEITNTASTDHAAGSQLLLNKYLAAAADEMSWMMTGALAGDPLDNLPPPAILPNPPK